jgi:hypothetical protein
MSIKIVLIGLILLLASTFSGCTLFQKTEFQLISSNIIDDDGFVGLELNFNATDTITLKILNPNKLVVFSEEFYRGPHNVVAYLEDYRITPSSGNYTIKADDENGNSIFEKKLLFETQNPDLIDVVEYWWLEDRFSLVGLNITLRNNGDLPIYPYEVQINIEDKESSWFNLPTVVLPFQTKSVYCMIYVNDIAIGNNDVRLEVKNSKGETIEEKSYTVYPVENVEELKFSWRYLGGKNLVLPDVEFLYTYYLGLYRLDASDYAAYEFDRHDNKYTELVTNKLKSLYTSSTDIGIINYVASFVQNFEYVEDETDCDYPRYPIETLKEKKGDCEDKAILTASILKNLGYNVSLIQLPKHVAVGVHLDENATDEDYFIEEYYYLETSSTNWVLGKIPPEHKFQTNITVYTLQSRPILIHSWKNATRFSVNDGSDYIKMKILVENLGVTTANSFDIWGAFFSQGNIFFNQKTTSISRLEAATKKIVGLKLDVPQEFSTKLKTRIYLNDEMVHERESLSNFP